MTASEKTPPSSPDARPGAAAEPKKLGQQAVEPVGKQPERGGPAGPEPTRYGDWERNGRCVDF